MDWFTTLLKELFIEDASDEAIKIEVKKYLTGVISKEELGRRLYNKGIDLNTIRTEGNNE